MGLRMQNTIYLHGEGRKHQYYSELDINSDTLFALGKSALSTIHSIYRYCTSLIEVAVQSQSAYKGNNILELNLAKLH